MPRTPILRAFLACIVLGLSDAAAQDADAYALLVQRGNSALDRLDLESAEARFTEAIAAAESAGIGVRDVVEVERRLARVQGLRGAAPDAVVTLRRAIERWEKAFGATDAGLVGCLEDLAAQLRAQGEAQAALETLRRALSLVKDDPEGAQPAPGAAADAVRLRLLDAYVKIAIALPDPNAVLDGAQKRLAILARMRGADSPDLTLPLKQIAQALRTLGRDKDAIPNIQMWIGIQEKVRGVDHPSIAEGLEDLVACQYAIGALDDADATITRWTRILKGVAGDHPNLVDTGEWSARVLARRGMHKEAADRLESAFTLAQRVLWNRTQRLGAIALALARESRECGRLERAEQCLQAARGYYATLGDASPEALQVETERARLDLALGQSAAAAAAMEATVARLEERFGKENRVLVEPLEILARAYRALDRGADAERVAQRAAALAGGR